MYLNMSKMYFFCPWENCTVYLSISSVWGQLLVFSSKNIIEFLDKIVG